MIQAYPSSLRWQAQKECASVCTLCRCEGDNGPKAVVGMGACTKNRRHLETAEVSNRFPRRETQSHHAAHRDRRAGVGGRGLDDAVGRRRRRLEDRRARRVQSLIRSAPFSSVFAPKTSINAAALAGTGESEILPTAKASSRSYWALAPTRRFVGGSLFRSPQALLTSYVTSPHRWRCRASDSHEEMMRTAKARNDDVGQLRPRSIAR